MKPLPPAYHLTIDTVEHLARAFSYLLIRDLGDNLDAVNERNREHNFDPNLCASHDFIDANQTMIEAMAILGLDLDAGDEVLTDTINKAWQIAKEREFEVYIGSGDFF
jgi:hypothetical protein